MLCSPFIREGSLLFCLKYIEKHRPRYKLFCVHKKNGFSVRQMLITQLAVQPISLLYILFSVVLRF